jgi:uncharacterized protein YndB with AHSA1/START domain
VKTDPQPAQTSAPTDGAVLVEPGTVRFQRLLPGPVERVWAYLTEPDKRATWLAGGAIDLRVGGRTVLEFDNARLSDDPIPAGKPPGAGKGTFDGVVTRLEPLRVLSHTWRWDSGETEVTYELTPQGTDVLLTVVHRRIGARGTVVAVMGGWEVHTGILADVLNGVPARPFWREVARLEPRYEAMVPAAA